MTARHRELPATSGVLPWQTVYDPVLYDEYTRGVEDDLEFYLTEARRAGSPILELGAGTGRVCIEIAADGYEVTALELDAGMVARGREKAAQRLPGKLRDCLQWVEGDMADFDLGRQYSLILIPFRAFQHLYTVDAQLACLRRCREHLAPGGRLVVDLFDPRLDLMIADQPCDPVTRRSGSFRHENGNEVIIYSTTAYDLAGQVLTADWLFEEIDAHGAVVARQHRELRMRWLYRFEMEHLLARAGFRVHALFGDFRRGPFRHGGEQVWVAVRSGDDVHDPSPAGTGQTL